MKQNNPTLLFRLSKHFNKLRYLSLSLILTLLVLIPCLTVFQNFLLAHAYDLLTDQQKSLYDVMEWFTGFFLSDPATQISHIKGTTWTAEFWGVKVSDPLAVLSFIFSSKTFQVTFILSCTIPFMLSIIFGRYFCAWICPASLIYELNHNLSLLINGSRLIPKNFRLTKNLKYLILVSGLILSAILGIGVFTLIYPPLIVGRELFFAIALSGFSSGVIFFIFTLLIDFLFSERIFCNYFCPGGALFSLLGRYRLLRVQRDVSSCTNCMRCTAVCEFDLDPMQDCFGQECTNCTACISQCPADSLSLTVKWRDQSYQGDGHQSHAYKKIIGKEFTSDVRSDL